ncbi:MAG: hypothetical protein JRJ66_01570 [Deltaproteobacteria bacterium]|nr:hypothetical protein [Deltaproteobacteria bacterium]MBW2081666.1 hypothetical protein [Deltaproteobacteria bacterium]
MSTAQKEWQWYADELMSEECLCGRSKKRHYSFCYRCFKALPEDMQKALYQRIGEGYEEAFEEAVKWLDRNIW